MIIRKLKCQQCGHKWLPRIEDPIECPSCKSRKWKKKRIKKDV